MNALTQVKSRFLVQCVKNHFLIQVNKSAMNALTQVKSRFLAQFATNHLISQVI
jgi:hypothetical protein